jgi:preprotein translocase subunit SecD
MKYGNHKNFHGSRDMYSVFKHIKARLTELTENSLTDEILLEILTESIERNFSGELYQITDVNRAMSKAVGTSAISSKKTEAAKPEKKKKVSSLRSRLRRKKVKKKDEEVQENKPDAVELPSNASTAQSIFGQSPELKDVKFDGNSLYNNQKELIYISGLPNLYRYKIRNQGKIENLKKFTYETSSQTFMRQLITISPYLRNLQSQQLYNIYH